MQRPHLLDAGDVVTALARRQLEEQRTSLYNTAVQAGATETEAQALVDTMLGVRDDIQTNFDLTGVDGAQERINRFITTNDGRRIRIYTDVDGNVSYSITPVGPVARASGGYVPQGIGGDIDDRYNTRLSGGEYVLDKQATYQIGVGILDMLNNGQSPGTPSPRTAVPTAVTINVNIHADSEDLATKIARKSMARAASEMRGMGLS